MRAKALVSFHAHRASIARLKVICAEKDLSMSKGINLAIKEWNARQLKEDPSLGGLVEEKLRPLIEAEMKAYLSEFE